MIDSLTNNLINDDVLQNLGDFITKFSEWIVSYSILIYLLIKFNMALINIIILNIVN